jgi:hypothetical protein
MMLMDHTLGPSGGGYFKKAVIFNRGIIDHECSYRRINIYNFSGKIPYKRKS